MEDDYVFLPYPKICWLRLFELFIEFLLYIAK